MANGNGNAVINNDPMVNVPVFDLSVMQKQYDAIKQMARDGLKKGEVAKHRTPQIKRSLGCLMDINFSIEDIRELMVKVKSDQELGQVDANDLQKMEEQLNKIDKLVQDEMDANKIASKSGWRTLKYFEADS